MRRELPDAQLVEASDVHLKYKIEESPTLRLSTILEKVETARQQIDIDDYGVSQTSLEQVTFERVNSTVVVR